MGALSVWHWAIILVVLVVLFGSKKLPDAARGLGRSLRIFKSEIKEMQNDGKDVTPTPPPAPTQIEAPSATQAPAAPVSQPQSVQGSGEQKTA